MAELGVLFYDGHDQNCFGLVYMLIMLLHLWVRCFTILVYQAYQNQSHSNTWQEWFLLSENKQSLELKETNRQTHIQKHLAANHYCNKKCAELSNS